MKLVLAEKPSVAQSIANVIGANKRYNGYLEGNEYVVSWCIGHLVELSQPEAYNERYSKWNYNDLPIIPEQWQYKVSSATQKQFNVIQTLMKRKDIDSIICATDAGREGELIFRLVYNKCGCKKPVERLWISSMEDIAIKQGFKNLKSSTEYDALYQAALCRERADWIVGINATRLFSVLYHQTLNIGRVMTPTLALIVEHEAEINAFKSKPFFIIELDIDDLTAESKRFYNKEQAEILLNKCKNSGSAAVKKVNTTEITENPPKLYDLTSLQRDANRLLGYTAQQTLDYAQSLYEKKLITYPRTDSRFLTDDIKETLRGKVYAISTMFSEVSNLEIDMNIENIINNKKVSDHHAIIPTESATNTDISALPVGELELLKLIVCRVLCAVADKYKYEETVITFECQGEIFTAKGKKVKNLGWKQIEKCFYPSNEETSEIMSVQDKEVPLTSATLKEGKTTPPKHYTEDTILQQMQRAGIEDKKGLGTPATRASIIEKLVKVGFLERKGDKKTKFLIPTQKGSELISIVPEQLKSPSTTANWEEKLSMIEHGKYNSQDFMQEINYMMSEIVKNYKVSENAKFTEKNNKIVGKCPCCGEDIAEMQKGFFCQSGNCKFAIWKNNRYFESIGKAVTSSIVSDLLNDGKVKLKGCKSARTGKIFDATLIMNVNADGKINFDMKFDLR